MTRTINSTKWNVITIVLVLLFLCNSSILFAQPKVALVLGGGGAKGFAHIGVLKMLEEEGIPIDIIVGTSIGSIAGGLYAIGYTADEIAALAQNANWEQLLSDHIPRKYLSPQNKALDQRYLFSLPFNEKHKLTLPGSLVTGQNVIALFCEMASEVPQNIHFSDLPISFACVTTDLETGEEVILNEGFLPKAIFSSMSIPGAFSPSEYNGRLLVDGGLVNNFPTDVAKQMGADIIIGVDLDENYKTRNELKSINDVIDQLISFNITQKKIENIKRCDVYINPNTKGYGISSFYASAVDTLLHRGYEAAKDVLSQIRTLKENYNLTPKTISRNYISEKLWYITDISIAGNTILSKNAIKNNLGLKINEFYNSEDINNAIYDLIGNSSVEMAYYILGENSIGKTLQLYVKEIDAAELKIGKTTANLNVGLNINSTDGIQLLLNTTAQRYSKALDILSVDAVISPNPELSIQLENSRGRMPSFGILLEGKYSKFNFFVDGIKSNAAEAYYAAGSLYTHKRLGYFFDFGGGIKQEYFDGKIFGETDEPILPLGNRIGFVSNFYGFLKFDNLDNYYFPTKGIEMYAEYSLINDLRLENDLGGALLVKMSHVVPFSPQITMLLNLNARALFNANTSSFKRTIIGGEDYDIYMNYHLPFIGIYRIFSVSDYAATLSAGIRFNFMKIHYLTLKGNLFFDNDNLNQISETRTLWGLGLSYKINSGFGPLELTAGFSDYYKSSTLSLNLGYWF